MWASSGKGRGQEPSKKGVRFLSHVGRGAFLCLSEPWEAEAGREEGDSVRPVESGVTAKSRAQWAGGERKQELGTPDGTSLSPCWWWEKL